MAEADLIPRSRQTGTRALARHVFAGTESEGDGWLYRSAGLAFLHALAWLIAPWWLFAHARPWQLTATTRVMGALLLAADGILAVVVMLALGRLLRERFRFHRVRRYIVGLVLTYSLGGLLSILGFYAELHLYFVIAVYTAPTALFLAALGLGLLRLPRDDSSLVRPFAYLQIGTGMLMASYYFASLAPLCGAIGGIVLTLLFIEQASHKRAEPQTYSAAPAA